LPAHEIPALEIPLTFLCNKTDWVFAAFRLLHEST